MRKLMKKLEELFVEITFAEDREFNSARKALKRFAQNIEDTFIAVAFAEAGEFESAADYINKDGEDHKPNKTTKRVAGLCIGRA